MTMAVLTDFPRAALRPNPLRALWAWHLRHREARAAARRLGALDDHLLADMGLDPASVRGRRDGWDHLPTNGYLIRRRQARQSFPAR